MSGCESADTHTHTDRNTAPILWPQLLTREIMRSPSCSLSLPLSQCALDMEFMVHDPALWLAIKMQHYLLNLLMTDLRTIRIMIKIKIMLRNHPEISKGKWDTCPPQKKNILANIHVMLKHHVHVINRFNWYCCITWSCKKSTLCYQALHDCQYLPPLWTSHYLSLWSSLHLSLWSSHHLHHLCYLHKKYAWVFSKAFFSFLV